MKNIFFVNSKIKRFDTALKIEGDKSLSIRWALLASQASGTSYAKNILRSDDVLNTLKCLKKLGVELKQNKNVCKIKGLGINGYKYKKLLTLDAGNSGTLARLILGLLIHSKGSVKIVGDKSLSKRDFLRVIEPLKKFGAKFSSKNNKLPIIIKGTTQPRPIKYFEKRGSAQCKTSVMFASLNTKGTTVIKAKKSRNHTELLFKYLNLPISIASKKNFDLIKVSQTKKFRSINYEIPSDISSCAFFIVLTSLSYGSKLILKNVNINPSRVGVIKILKKMGASIKYQNIKYYKGEKISDLLIIGRKYFRPINCPEILNSSAIDEFLVIFLVAAKANGVSYFKGLSELNHKESPRLKWGSKILNLMGIKTIVNKDSIKIYGNPNLTVNKNVVIKDFLKDHRVFMTSVIAALVFGGNWKIHDKESINSSFPTFLKLINILKKRAKKH